MEVTINGVKGFYAGECTIQNKLKRPHGWGMLETNDKLVLGFVQNGSWVEESQRIVIYKNKNEFRVLFSERQRNGIIQYTGQIFQEEGLVASGYFEGERLIRHKQIEVSNLFGLRGKYTINKQENYRQIGEHNKAG